jgi:2,4-dienoyl-CoA reductase-like NADH-dependent reductase (Old Yellow Enzyme family)
MSFLFSPITLGGITLPNRLVVAPMCQYSARDGLPQPWHMQHLGTMALSGCGLVIQEATAVEDIGRITPADMGLWNDAQERADAEMLAGLRSFSRPALGVQLSHAGRKASSTAPWVDRGRPLTAAEGAWPRVGPSAIPFESDWPTPAALDADGLKRIREAFVASARRADRAGYDLLELHGAHGYLLSEFLSGLANQRDDDYGGSRSNRMRFPLEVAAAVREVWPRSKALGMRLNGSDWAEGGVEPEDAAVMARELHFLGFDFVHLSSGGLASNVKIPGNQPGYQVPFAHTVKQAVPDLTVIAVGMINDPCQAEEIIETGQADMVALARALLDDPRWAWRAADRLNGPSLAPEQYARATKKTWAGYVQAHHELD